MNKNKENKTKVKQEIKKEVKKEIGNKRKIIKKLNKTRPKLTDLTTKKEIAVTSKSYKMNQRGAKFSSKDGNVRVCHSEYVLKIITSSKGNNSLNGLTVCKFFINPGLALFTWLKQLASNYKNYKFQNIRFNYIPSCPTTTPTTNEQKQRE